MQNILKYVWVFTAYFLGCGLGVLLSLVIMGGIAKGKEPPTAVLAKEPPIARVPPMAVVRETSLPVVVIPSYQPKPLTQSTVVSGVTTNRPFVTPGQYSMPHTTAQTAGRVNTMYPHNVGQPILTLVPGVQQFGITNCTSYG